MLLLLFRIVFSTILQAILSNDIHHTPDTSAPACLATTGIDWLLLDTTLLDSNPTNLIGPLQEEEKSQHLTGSKHYSHLKQAPS